MKIQFAMILILISSLTGNCQPEIFNKIFRFDARNEMNLLPDVKSFVKTVELYKNDELTQKYTEETFYNYDSIRICFEYDEKFNQIIDLHCEFKKVSNELDIQIAHYLYEDEHEKDSMYIYKNGERIDSMKSFVNGELEKSVKFIYKNDKIIEKQYYMKSFGKSIMRFQYADNQVSIKYEKNGLFEEETIYTIQDSVILLKRLNKKNEILLDKEFVVKVDNRNRIIEKREYDFQNEDTKILYRVQKFSYEDDSEVIFEELPTHQITVKTINDTWAGEKIIETNWLKKKEKRIERFINLE